MREMTVVMGSLVISTSRPSAMHSNVSSWNQKMSCFRSRQREGS
ncbi:MAG: hypothetical protein Q8L55_10470 [Phycisphaerales bacterium]|nr:hypothetical protein [Phycisphaerales bacterium]